jgi:hypothetical protein
VSPNNEEDSMDKLCATCGKPLPPDQAFCVQCGAAWTPDAGAAPPTTPATTPATAATTPASPTAAPPVPPVPQVTAPAHPANGRSSKALLIVAIAVIALGLGIGGWLFMRSRAAGTSVGTSTASSHITVPSSTPASNGAQVAVVPGAPLASEAAPGDPPATAADTEAAAGSKPCSLLTRAEMETILGSKVVKVTTSELACNYFTDDTLSAGVETTWTGGKGAFAQVKGFNSAPGLSEPVPGIGDEAYMQAAGVLHVLKNDTYVVVNSRVYPNELKTESAIATKAMEKLK